MSVISTIYGIICIALSRLYWNMLYIAHWHREHTVVNAVNQFILELELLFVFI